MQTIVGHGKCVFIQIDICDCKIRSRGFKVTCCTVQSADVIIADILRLQNVAAFRAINNILQIKRGFFVCLIDIKSKIGSVLIIGSKGGAYQVVSIQNNLC